MSAPRTRTEKIDCDCRTVHRPHGHPHTYRYHRCGCDECRRGHRAYLNHLETQKRLGNSSYVPADRAATRIKLLQERGVTIRDQARMLGYHHGTLYRIASGARRTKWCRREIYEDILTIPLPRRKNPS